MTRLTLYTPPPSKVARRPYSWPRRSSSYSETTKRFVSERPTYHSAHFVGNAFSSSSSLHSNNNEEEARNDKSCASNGHDTSRIASNHDRVMPRWNVTTIQPVPTHYPLERTCLTVTGIPLNVLCNRISNFARVNSMETNFHKTQVDCVTMGLLKFSVKLWKASRSSNDGVIVEIQRRRGCCIAMQHVRHGLVQAITTGDAPVIVSERSNTRTVNCSVLPHAHQSECWNALKITKRLLESTRYDQNRLGMESMVAMTNPHSVHAKDAKLVCRSLVYGSAPFGDALRDSLVKYFRDAERGEDTAGDETAMDYDSDSDDGEDEYAQGSHYGSMHNLALQVLANALQVVNDLDDNRTAGLSLVDLASPFWSTICNALVYNIEVSNHRPREAALSAKCLNLLARLAPVICNCPVMDRLEPRLLEQVNEYGKACNLLLERESLKLMGTLGAGAS